MASLFAKHRFRGRGPSRGAGRRALFARSSARLCRRQSRRLRQCARRLPAQRLQASGVSRRRRRSTAPTPSCRFRCTTTSIIRQPLCRDQEGQRADGAFLQPSLPAAGHGPAVLHGLRAVGPARHGDVHVRQGDPRGQRRSSCSTMARCGAISPTSTTSAESSSRLIDRIPARSDWSATPDPASSAPWRIYNIGNNRPEELAACRSAAGEGVRPHGDQGNAADAAGRRAGDLRRCRRSDARRRLPAGDPIEDGICAISSRGIATITRFEAPMRPTNYPTDHVRRRRNAAVAGLARGPAEAVPAAVRHALDLSGHAAAGVGSGAVRAADRHHQCRLSLHGAGATRRDRHRGRHPAGADAARFRAGDRGRCRLCADARRRRDRAGARRRSRGARHRGLRRRLPRRGWPRPKPGAS